MVGKPQNVPGDVLGRRLLRRGSETVSEERKGKVMPGGGWRKSHLPVLWAGGPSPSHTRVRVFYWSLIASQCCLSLRSSGAWIGGVYAGLPPWASPLPPPTAEGLAELRAATPWSPTATRRRPTLSICVSVPALEIEASVPFLQIPHTCVNNFFCFFFFTFFLNYFTLDDTLYVCSRHDKWPNFKNWSESVERREPSYTLGGNVNWYNPFDE